jgi:hypothetical protein
VSTESQRPPGAIAAVETVHVIRGALAMYRRFPGRVFVTAILVFVPVTFLETLLHRLLEAVHATHGMPALVLGLTVATSVGVTIAFGELLFSGVMDESVGATIEREPLPPLGEVIGSLPFRTLLLADLIAMVAVGVGISLLIVPGVIVFTLTCIAGPVIIIERNGAMASLRRSARLVWPHFWTAFLAVAIPLALEASVLRGLIGYALHMPWPAVTALGAVFGVTIGAVVGLCEVVLGRALIQRDRAGERAPAATP